MSHPDNLQHKMAAGLGLEFPGPADIMLQMD